MRLPTFSCETVLAGRARIVDLRSPAEFARDHLPEDRRVSLAVRVHTERQRNHPGGIEPKIGAFIEHTGRLLNRVNNTETSKLPVCLGYAPNITRDDWHTASLSFQRSQAKAL